MQFIREHWRSLLLLGAGLIVTFMAASYVIIQKNTQDIYGIESATLMIEAETIDVGIVFGGGINDDGPRPLLQDRLDTAKELYDLGKVSKLILSGDNRTLDYNEPAAMFDYLTERGVPEESLQVDFAGRSTYETCERANKVFGVNRAILISESTHLARAIYLCEHFGIESYGLKSDGEASSGLRVGQRWREVLARSKAIINAYIIGEQTVLGDPIEL